MRKMPLSLPSTKITGQFQENGYLLARQALPAECCRAWKQQALALAKGHAVTIQQEAAHDSLRYKVLTGEIIKNRWPALLDLYQDLQLRNWVKAVTGAQEIFLSPHLRSAININLLAEPNEVYRWHFDAVAFTLLLYLSDSAVEDGGALEFYPNSDGRFAQRTYAKVEYRPHAGDILLMDGTRCYHRVAPILRPHVRISIPMVFPCVAEHARPVDLDSYLYTRAA